MSDIHSRLRILNALLVVSALVTLAVLYFVWSCR